MTAPDTDADNKGNLEGSSRGTPAPIEHVDKPADRRSVTSRTCQGRMAGRTLSAPWRGRVVLPAQPHRLVRA